MEPQKAVFSMTALKKEPKKTMIFEVRESLFTGNIEGKKYLLVLKIDLVFYQQYFYR